FGLIISSFIFTGNAEIGDYSMSLSYYMLLPALLYLNRFIERFNIFSFLLFIISLIIIISLGSRGALLCVGVYAILKIIRFDLKSTRKAFIFRITVLISILVGIFKFQNILIFLENQLTKYGLSSRTLTLLQQDTIHLSGRDVIA